MTVGGENFRAFRAGKWELFYISCRRLRKTPSDNAGLRADSRLIQVLKPYNGLSACASPVHGGGRHRSAPAHRYPGAGFFSARSDGGEVSPFFVGESTAPLSRILTLSVAQKGRLIDGLL